MSEAKYGRPNGPLRVTSEKPEVNGNGIVCCGYTSGQMVANLVNPAVPDKMVDGAHEARAFAGRPHNNGSNAGEVREGTKDAMGVEMVSADMAGVKAALKAGKGAVYNHEYGVLPSYMRNQSGSFGHSACLAYWTDENGGMAGWYDPLAGQGSKGMWAKWSDLQGAAWGGSAHSVSKKAAPDDTPPPPPEPDCPDCPEYPVPDYAYMERQAVAVERQNLLRDMYEWVTHPTGVAPFPVNDAIACAALPNAPWDVGKWNQTTWYLRPVNPDAAKWDEAVWAGVTPVTGGTWG